MHLYAWQVRCKEITPKGSRVHFHWRQKWNSVVGWIKTYEHRLSRSGISEYPRIGKSQQLPSHFWSNVRSRQANCVPSNPEATIIHWEKWRECAISPHPHPRSPLPTAVVVIVVSPRKKLLVWTAIVCSIGITVVLIFFRFCSDVVLTIQETLSS